MKKRYVLIIFLASCLFFVACEKGESKEIQNNSVKNITNEASEIKNLEDNIYALNMEKEEYRKSYEYIAEKYEALDQVNDFYKLIADEYTEKEGLKNKIAFDLLHLNFGIGNTRLKDGVQISLKGLLGHPLEVSVSYNILSNEVRYEYLTYFEEAIPAINLEKMLDIKTNGKYEIENESIDKIQSDSIVFTDLKAGDKITIKMNKNLKNLTDYKSDTININIIE